jgi:hypothetical protein
MILYKHENVIGYNGCTQPVPDWMKVGKEYTDPALFIVPDTFVIVDEEVK